MPRLRATLGAKGAKRAPKTRNPRWSWASRRAGSSQSPGSSRQPSPTPSRTGETPKNPPTRRQRRGSPSEGFLKALYVHLSSFFFALFQLVEAAPWGGGGESAPWGICASTSTTGLGLKNSEVWGKGGKFRPQGAKEQRGFGERRKIQA